MRIRLAHQLTERHAVRHSTRKTNQWQDCIAVIRNTLRADCGHPTGDDIYRFRVDEQLGETYSLCAHCGAVAEKQGLTVYRFNPEVDKRPYALKRLEL